MATMTPQQIVHELDHVLHVDFVAYQGFDVPILDLIYVTVIIKTSFITSQRFCQIKIV